MDGRVIARVQRTGRRSAPAAAAAAVLGVLSLLSAGGLVVLQFAAPE
jgi:hypothetical protein